MKTNLYKLFVLGTLLTVCHYAMADIAADGGYVQKSWTGKVSGDPIYERVVIPDYGCLKIVGTAEKATHGADIWMTGITLYKEINGVPVMRRHGCYITQWGSNETMDAYGVSPGVYYIELKAAMGYVSSYSTGTFSASTTFTPETYPSECEETHNDSAQYAIPLQNNVTVRGTVGYDLPHATSTHLVRDVVDFYRIYLKDDGEVRFKLDLELREKNDFVPLTVFYLYDDSLWTAPIPKPKVLDINVTSKLDTLLSLPRGYYFIKINPWYYFSAGGYEISYSIETTWPDAPEPNETYDKAVVLNEKEEVKGTVGYYPQDYDDYYCFTLTDYADIRIKYNEYKWLKGTNPWEGFNHFMLCYYPDKVIPAPTTLDYYILPLTAGPYDSSDEFVYKNTHLERPDFQPYYVCDNYAKLTADLPADGIIYKRLSPGTYYFRIHNYGGGWFGYAYSIRWEKTKTYDFGVVPQEEPLHFEYTAYPEITPNDSVQGVLGIYTVNDREKYQSSVALNKNIEDIFRYTHQQPGDLAVDVKAMAIRDEKLKSIYPFNYHYAVRLYRKKTSVTAENCHKKDDFDLFRTVEVMSENTDTTVIIKDIPNDLYYLQFEFYKLNDINDSRLINSYDAISPYQLKIAPMPFTAGFEVVQYNHAVKIINKSNARSFTWDFGDGKTSKAAFPEHTYAKVGEYVVTQNIHAGAVENVLVSKDTVIVRGIESYSPKHFGDNGTMSVNVYGGGLDATVSVTLTQGATTLKPTKIEKTTLGHISAIFDLDNAPNGKYDLAIRQANLIDTVCAEGITLTHAVYPKIITSIESTHNFQLRTGLSWPYWLVLENTGNIDALGVDAFLAVPEDVEVTFTNKAFRNTVDTTRTFDFYSSTFNRSYSISNKWVQEVMDSLSYEYVPVTRLFGKPYKGRVYKLFVPKIEANATVKLPIMVKGISELDFAESELVCFAENINLFNDGKEQGERWAVERLKRFTNVFFASLDSATLFQPTDIKTWHQTFRTRDDLIQKILQDDEDHAGYSMTDYYKGYYDDGLLSKQIAQIILGLRAVANDFSITKTPDGIIDLSESAYPASGNARRAQNAPSRSGKRWFKIVIENGKKIKKWYDESGLEEGYEIVSDFKETGESYIDTYSTIVTTDTDDAVQVFSTYLELGGQISQAAGATAPLIAPIFQAASMTLEAGVHVFGNYNKQLDEVMSSNEVHRAKVYTGGSRDPNAITGPQGYSSERYIPSSQLMNYVIQFENKAEASLAAQMVNITDTLDKDKFDLSTFELSTITLGDTIFQMPRGRQSYYFTYDMRPAHNWLVGISVKLDTLTGIVHWQMVTLDPVTKDLINDPIAGFLPPNKTAPEGEGSVSYTVKLKNNLTSMTTICNRADIVFDFNKPILTNIWTNTIDADKPLSSGVQATQLTDSTFVVTWNSEDAHSQVRYHKVFTSVNGSDFRLYGSIAGHQAVFYGQPDSLYCFYVEAVDSVGNAETKQPVSEASLKMICTAIGHKTIPYTSIDGLSVSPNPTRDYITVGGLQSESTIEIYDISGKRMLWTSVQPDEKIYVGHLVKGMYVVRANKQTAKLIVR